MMMVVVIMMIMVMVMIDDDDNDDDDDDDDDCRLNLVTKCVLYTLKRLKSIRFCARSLLRLRHSPDGVLMSFLIKFNFLPLYHQFFQH